jgi:hypothetical protein
MKTLLLNLFVSSMILILTQSCNKREQLVLPKRPLILIEATYTEVGIVNYSYKYKWIDQNGYIFYTTEGCENDALSKRILGDTLK